MSARPRAFFVALMHRNDTGFLYHALFGDPRWNIRATTPQVAAWLVLSNFTDAQRQRFSGCVLHAENAKGKDHLTATLDVPIYEAATSVAGGA